jgi:LacI family transcriptional regulator
VTIIDVARLAGVSVSTVSKVINDRYGVAPETYDKVMDIVSDLGYESSLVASSLRRHSTNVIGILVPEFEPFSTELLKGISSAVEGTGYELLAYSGNLEHNQVGWERRSLSRLAGTLIDGAVIVAPTASVTDATIPVVAVDPHTGKTGPSTVEADNVGGARAATQHLIELGHRRIAHIRGRTDLVSAQLREQGYREALVAAGIPFDPELVRVGGYRAAETTDAARELLSRSDRPTAVFAANDLSAIRVLEIARELGLRVPEDCSLTGFDGIEPPLSLKPMTSLRVPNETIGGAALVRLLNRIQHPKAHQRKILVETQFVEGTTIAVPPPVA